MPVAPTNTLKPQLLVLKEGDFVFEEGDEAIFAYVLTEGEIEIMQTVKGEPHVLGKVEKGTVFGEMAIIDGFPRSASARAATECKVQEVGHKEFINYISKKPDAAFTIMTRLSGFVRSADKQAKAFYLLLKLKLMRKKMIKRMIKLTSLLYIILKTQNLFIQGPPQNQ